MPGIIKSLALCSAIISVRALVVQRSAFTFMQKQKAPLTADACAAVSDLHAQIVPSSFVAIRSLWLGDRHPAIHGICSTRQKT